jgi:hypothetical protein
MSAWKVLIIGLLAAISLALGLATILIPMEHQGTQRWIWLGGLLTATLFVGGLFTLFLRYAGRGLDASPNRSRR